MPVIADTVAEADHLFAQRESNLLQHSLWELVGSAAFWVNPLASQRRTLLKPEQLRVARRAGFRVPATLYSNEPANVRAFLQRHSGGVVFKSLFPMSWQSDDGSAILFTVPVEEDDLPSDDLLAAAPGFFQEKIPKDFELRVTAIGRQLTAVKLRSQEEETARLDYRAAIHAVPKEPYELPSAVADSCHRILADLGLVFGCFDLVVTPAGDFVFLEINEMGAFLWLEEALPELRLLDSFCELLLQGRTDWETARGCGRQVRLHDIAPAAQSRMESERAEHLEPPPSWQRD